MPGPSIWNFWARWYDRLFVQRYVLEPTRRMVLERLQAAPPREVCDFGCGIGQLAREMACRWPDARVLAIDPSPGMIARTAEFPPLPNLVFRAGSLEVIEDDRRFDAITCTHVFPYLPDKAAILRRLHALLHPGGRLLLMQATCETPYDRLIHPFLKQCVSHAEYFSTGQLTALLRSAGFIPGAIAPLPRAWFIPSVFLIEADASRAPGG